MCNFFAPHLNLLRKILFRCGIVQRHFFLHLAPAILDRIKVRRTARPGSEYFIAAGSQLFLCHFCLVARCPVMLKVGAISLCHELWYLFFENIEINFSIDDCIFGHKPKPLSTLLGISTPNHYLWRIFKGWEDTCNFVLAGRYIHAMLQIVDSSENRTRDHCSVVQSLYFVQN